MRTVTQVKVLQATLFAVLLVQHLLAYRILDVLEETTAAWSINNSIDWLGLAFPLRDGLLFAQVALLIMWTHLGPGRWFVRWPLIAGLAWALGLMARDQFLSTWLQTLPDRAMQLIACQAAIVFVGLVAIQVCGFQLRKIQHLEPPAGKFRFSLRSLLATVLLSGVAVRLGQLGYAHVLKQPRLPDLIAITSVAMPLAAAPLLALWATLQPGKCWLRMLVFAIVAPALGIAGPYVCGHLAEWRGFVMWTSIEAALVGASLLIVRACGYRLVRIRFRDVSTAAAVSSSLSVAGA